MSKLIAVSLFGGQSGMLLGLWMAVECLLVLLARVAMDNFVWYAGAGEKLEYSLAMLGQPLFYLLMQTAPFPILRVPFLLSPSIYAFLIVWNVCCSNPIQVFAAYNWFDNQPDFDPRIAMGILAAGVVLCAIGGAVTLMTMDKKYR